MPSIIDDMAQEIYSEQRSFTEEELQKDATWIEASKIAYKSINGSDFNGTDEEAASEGLNMMGEFNYNLSLGTVPMSLKIEDATDEEKLAFYYMMDAYDKKDISWNGVGRFLKGIGTDPTTYVGIGTLGAGFAVKGGTQMAAKEGLKAMLKTSATKFLSSPTAIAATEGALYTGIDDLARQNVAVEAGVQEEISPTQTALMSGAGALGGAGIVKGTEYLGKGLNKAFAEGQEEMARMAGGGTPSEKNLIIQHNLSEENLAHAEKIGGLPVPSLAITNKGTPLEGFGDITMLGDEALAKPSRHHKVFGSDIYSPRYPTINKKLPFKKEKEIKDDLIVFAEKIGRDEYDIDTSDLGNSLPMKAKFLDSKNIDIPVYYEKLSDLEQEQVDFFSEVHNPNILNKDNASNPEFANKVREWLELKGATDMLDDTTLNRVTKQMAQTLTQLDRRVSNGDKVDAFNTSKSINEIISKNKNEYSDFVEDYYKSKGAKDTIYAGTDDMGRQKWIAHTVSNVVKQMKKNLRGGENFGTSVGTARAKVTPEFKTLNEIIKSKDKLVNREDFGKIVDDMDDYLDELTRRINHREDANIRYDDILKIVEEYADTGKLKDEIEFYIKNPSKETQSLIGDFVSSLQSMPTEYFETKMLRKMELGEFKYAVIPLNASDRTKQILDNKGIEYSTYDNNLDGDRVKQIKKAAEENGYLFALPFGIMITEEEDNNQ